MQPMPVSQIISPSGAIAAASIPSQQQPTTLEATYMPVSAQQTPQYLVTPSVALDSTNLQADQQQTAPTKPSPTKKLTKKQLQLLNNSSSDATGVVDDNSQVINEYKVNQIKETKI